MILREPFQNQKLNAISRAETIINKVKNLIDNE